MLFKKFEINSKCVTTLSLIYFKLFFFDFSF